MPCNWENFAAFVELLGDFFSINFFYNIWLVEHFLGLLLKILFCICICCHRTVCHVFPWIAIFHWKYHCHFSKVNTALGSGEATASVVYFISKSIWNLQTNIFSDGINFHQKSFWECVRIWTSHLHSVLRKFCKNHMNISIGISGQ